MTKYRVRDGCRFGARNQHGPGAVVDLSEKDAAPFLDKLERVADEPAYPDQPADDAASALSDQPDAADDLTVINGIGDSTEEALNELGVYTYADLMAIIDESPHLLRDNIRGISGDKVTAWRADAAALLGAE